LSPHPKTYIDALIFSKKSFMFFVYFLAICVLGAGKLRVDLDKNVSPSKSKIGKKKK